MSKDPGDRSVIGCSNRHVRVVALLPFVARRDCELSFEKDDVLEVVRTKKSGWLIARNLQGEMGEVPVNYFNGDLKADIPECADEALEQDVHDDVYFYSYGQNMFIHWEMLSDTSRTNAYREALTPEVVRGKVVLDIGCGTGILSMFCAKSGAKQVFAVDASDMAVNTRKIVAANGFSNVIEVIQGSVEEIVLPCKVDLIVSEWMGTMLFFEAMFEDVILARDKWLKPDGLMCPSWASMYVAGVSLPELWRKKVGLWEDVYGFDMRTIKEQALDYFFERPVISEYVTREHVITSLHEIAAFDLRTATVQELQMIQAEIFGCKATNDGEMHAVLSWFDVGFGDMAHRAELGIYPPEHLPAQVDAATDRSAQKDEQVYLSTSPWSQETHWRHTLLVFKEPCELNRGDTINMALDMRKNVELPRHYHIELGIENDRTEFAFAKLFRLWA